MTLKHQFTIFGVTGAVGVATVLSGGCATKSYVQQQTAPLVDKVNQIDTQDATNAANIKSLDQRTQQGLQEVSQANQNAVNSAQQAQQQAQQVSGKIGETQNQITSLNDTVANLDDYKQAYTSNVLFAFDKSDLTPASRQTLDDMVTRLQQDPHAIVEIRGYTDPIGTAKYNDGLSQRRADAVARYLQEKSVPPHRIFMIGLGIDQGVADHETAAERQQNRRVDVNFLVNNLSSEKSGS